MNIDSEWHQVVSREKERETKTAGAADLDIQYLCPHYLLTYKLVSKFRDRQFKMVIHWVSSMVQVSTLP